VALNARLVTFDRWLADHASAVIEASPP